MELCLLNLFHYFVNFIRTNGSINLIIVKMSYLVSYDYIVESVIYIVVTILSSN